MENAPKAQLKNEPAATAPTTSTTTATTTTTTSTTSATPAVSEEQHQHRPQRTQSLSATLPRIQTSHTRSASVATSSSSGRKRLSLSFPVLPPGCDPPPRNYSPATPLSSSVGLTTPPNGDVSPEDSSAFLTALAAQERRVLELREELSKAESELAKLKRQWTNHEANKSRHELLGSGLSTPQRAATMRDAMTSPTNREEFERRQSMRGTAGSSGRKVLPSQRHQRTLSLLAPERTEFRQPFPQPKDLDSDPAPAKSQGRCPSPNTNGPEPASFSARAASLDLADRPKGQDVFIKTGQQIAADFRDGIWTLLEDLRSAAVGDDTARKPPTPAARSNTVRRISSKANLRSPSVEKKPDGIAAERRQSKDLRKPRKGKKAAEIEESPTDSSDQSSVRDAGDPSFRWSSGSSATLSDYPDPSGIITPPSRASTPRTSTRLVISFSPELTPPPPPKKKEKERKRKRKRKRKRSR